MRPNDGTRTSSPECCWSPSAEHGDSLAPETSRWQAVIGFAVTRDGTPVRCWVQSGDTVDATVISEVKRDLSAWKLGRIVMVLDTAYWIATQLAEQDPNRRTKQGSAMRTTRPGQNQRSVGWFGSGLRQNRCPSTVSPPA